MKILVIIVSIALLTSLSAKEKNYFVGIDYGYSKDVDNTIHYTQLKVGKYFNKHRIYLDAGYDVQNNGNYFGVNYNYMYSPLKFDVRTYLGVGISRLKTAQNSRFNTRNKITIFEYGVVVSLVEKLEFDTKINFKYGSYGGVVQNISAGFLYNY